MATAVTSNGGDTTVAGVVDVATQAAAPAKDGLGDAGQKRPRDIASDEIEAGMDRSPKKPTTRDTIVAPGVSEDPFGDDYDKEEGKTPETDVGRDDDAIDGVDASPETEKKHEDELDGEAVALYLGVDALRAMLAVEAMIAAGKSQTEDLVIIIIPDDDGEACNIRMAAKTHSGVGLVGASFRCECLKFDADGLSDDNTYNLSGTSAAAAAPDRTHIACVSAVTAQSFFQALRTCVTTECEGVFMSKPSVHTKGVDVSTFAFMSHAGATDMVRDASQTATCVENNFEEDAEATQFASKMTLAQTGVCISPGDTTAKMLMKRFADFFKTASETSGESRGRSMASIRLAEYDPVAADVATRDAFPKPGPVLSLACSGRSSGSRETFMLLGKTTVSSDLASFSEVTPARTLAPLSVSAFRSGVDARQTINAVAAAADTEEDLFGDDGPPTSGSGAAPAAAELPVRTPRTADAAAAETPARTPSAGGGGGGGRSKQRLRDLRKAKMQQKRVEGVSTASRDVSTISFDASVVQSLIVPIQRQRTIQSFSLQLPPSEDASPYALVITVGIPKAMICFVVSLYQDVDD
jgi:hypothetical protein